MARKPHEIIRAMVRVIDPKPGETIYDPCCGTGGFLVQAYLYLLDAAQEKGLLFTPPIVGREVSD
jgi:type I restriction-modification system DNA methylase subunit